MKLTYIETEWMIKMNDEKKQIRENLRIKKQKIMKDSKSIEIGLTLKEMKTGKIPKPTEDN